VLIPFALACVAGLLLLAKASDALVVGSSAMATRLGVPTLVVGVVIIGFGTSSPELLVAGLAAARGSAAMGVGAVIGSNIANLSLVLGVGAIVAPLVVRAAVVRREVPTSLLATAAFAVAVLVGMTRVCGLVLLGLLIVALTLMVRWSLADRKVVETEAEFRQEVTDVVAGEAERRTAVVLAQALLGLVGTLIGAQILVWGAVGIAREASLSEGFIGATIVAIGTSLPELVTATQAARRGESDLIIGNLLGSNLFNALAVGGLVALISGGVVVDPGLRHTGLVVLLLVSSLAMLMMRRNFQVLRWEGIALLAVYAVTVPLLAGP
jgi:cation:H+ antiporter